MTLMSVLLLGVFGSVFYQREGVCCFNSNALYHFLYAFYSVNHFLYGFYSVTLKMFTPADNSIIGLILVFMYRWSIFAAIDDYSSFALLDNICCSL